MNEYSIRNYCNYSDINVRLYEEYLQEALLLMRLYDNTTSLIEKKKSNPFDNKESYNIKN